MREFAQLNEPDLEMLESVLHNDGSIVLANNERTVIPETLRFLWETESLHNISPSLLATVGVLCMSCGDVGWRLMLASWLEQRQYPDKDQVRTLCELYVEEVVQFVQELTKRATQAKPHETGPFYKRVMPMQSVENMVQTFTYLLQVRKKNV